MTKSIEVLAPCGSMASFEAAVNAGADAVYLAGNRFGARAYAENFDEKTLCNVIDKAHLKGVKVYLTVNTLFKNAEISELPMYLRPFYETGLDAVIVQDLGVFDVIKTSFPDLPIHTSTQMNICSAEGAQLLKDLGAERIIPARELTLDEVINIKKKVCTEVEVFVHGAMCYCYSGRCLMSSMIGDRSGNRGRCAQPCRRLYNDKYLMSMKDMCALPYVPQLIDAGIDSLKIEGRMKGAYYTAAVVDAYRQIADDHISGCFSMDKCEKYIERLSETFSRGGFCKGYFEKAYSDEMIDKNYNGHKGLKVGTVVSAGHGKVEIDVTKNIGVRDILTMDIAGNETVEVTSNSVIDAGNRASFNAASSGKIKKGTVVYRKINNSLMEEIESSLIKKEKLMPIDIILKLHNGEKLSISLGSGSKTVSVEGNVVSPAEKRIVTDDQIMDKLRGLGESGYYLNKLTIDNDNSSFISFGEIKQLRREALQKLDEEILSGYRRVSISENTARLDISDIIAVGNKKLFIMPETMESAEGLKQALEGDEELVDELCKKYDLEFGLNTDMVTIKTLCELNGVFSKYGRTAAAFPYIHREEDEAYFSSLYNLIHSNTLLNNNSFDALYIRNIDDLSMILNRSDSFDKDIILASSLYAYNNRCISFLYDLVKDRFRSVSFEYSHELTAKELRELSFPMRAGRGIYIYGQESLMITAQKSKGFIKDERNNAFKYVQSNSLCYNRLLDGRLTTLDIDRLDEDRIDYDTLIISLHNESPADIAEILRCICNGSFGPITKGRKTTDGHFERPIL